MGINITQLDSAPSSELTLWLMVENVGHAIAELDKAGIYHFESKGAAKQYAKQLSLTSFKYLPISMN
ncbi:hypothetical protein D515_00634 [Grimontia indica]|uniref:Uncharacterized protein n=1 Tax=Grimontia indica TaxID=1056512 RepID=R1IHY2_9GAMM|nr:hypothetical protein [Grimontia indica]EOD80346.1 hypothetical protein D515_00634 [Grimontia indica]